MDVKKRIKLVVLSGGSKHRSISSSLRCIREGGQGDKPLYHGIGATVIYSDGSIVTRRLCDPRLLGDRSKIMLEKVQS